MGKPTEAAFLFELDADEMFDVAQSLKPDLTREDFDLQWAEFQALKAAKALT